MSSQPSEPDDPVQDGAVVSTAEDDGGWEGWRALTAQAYARFHEQLLAARPEFPGLADFAVVERAGETQGTIAWSWGAVNEIRETINAINSWGQRLHEWGAWNAVVDSYETDSDKWELVDHFVEPIAFYCMLQPSSITDRLTVAAETVLHQANLRAFPGEPDRLDQDKLKPGQRLRKEDRRKQLARIGQRWSQFKAFGTALRAMDDVAYRRATRNFRNLSAHSFAPRLMVGQVARAIRSIVPWTDLVPQPDGTFLPVQHPTRKGVQYAAHAMLPLDLNATRAANLAEYHKALAAMKSFSVLIDELCERMAAK